ncbi:3-oxoacyl-[acyl-carrier-protein] reductase FabG [Usitatibacter rugosus]|uniref:3-oxoacyl-[acyl-carrier-protein] reductase FabG n=1 Tax=Usitatibacter rugosus TaxID=2732067 RepID=A0A6M4H056_9PROT|nr:SDR family oxidoreductase [Usitatibacter rugosus]QJR12104.1 3-oxoacyl-[acyl-carrier-protein] reductase FabG [Usitatibacter rugosus]
MKIENAVAFVTGANRGIGLVFTQELLARGVRKVYAAAREPATIAAQRGVEAVRLDVTRPDEAAAAVARAGDVTLLVNNAGVAHQGGFLTPGSEALAHRMLEVNFFGMLRMSRAFAPVLAANGGGALLNVLSIASWVNGGQLAAYAASKSAAWSLTNALRHELRPEGTQVLALHMAYVDTDMVRGIDEPKTSALEIVQYALDGLEAGLDEVLADERTRLVKQGLTAPRPSYLPPRAG